MVVGIQKASWDLKSSQPSKDKLQQADAGLSRQKEKMAHPTCCLQLAECVTGEAAAPGTGSTAVERQMWGEVFRCRQDFVEMHLC